jgi:hypothetical protein
MTPEEIQARMRRVLELLASMDPHRRELAIEAGLLDRRFAEPPQPVAADGHGPLQIAH